MFKVANPEHVWNGYEDKEFLRMLGGYSKDRTTGLEGLTMAGLLMFGKGFQFEKNSIIFLWILEMRVVCLVICVGAIG
jgi:hypothetical protein